MLAVARGGATVIFVSHNLQAVADLCPRCLLLDRGRVAAQGPTAEVVGGYFKAVTVSDEKAAHLPVYVSHFTVRNRAGETIRFTSGERVRVDVEVAARERVERLSVALGVLDENRNLIFSASTERLGAPAFTLDPGGKIAWSFELDLHLAPGTYTVGAALFRYDVQRDYGQFPGTTIFIHSDTDVRGVVNLYPRVVPPGAPFG
jgi:lipopolysaccharide transport system ATP-binding protein